MRTRSATPVPLASVLVLTLASSWAAGAAVLERRDSAYKWRLCPPARLVPVLPSYTDPDTPSDNIEIRADSVRLIEDDISQFTGDVEIVKDEQAIRADVVTYDDRQRLFRAEGRTHIWDAGMIWAGESALYDLDSAISALEQGQYWILEGRGRGHVLRLKHDREAQITTLEGVDYSTCPVSDEGWQMSASSIRLNHASDRGSARNAVLHVYDIPVFYFPYVNFPLSDKRKSGFLAPSVGTTNESGFDVRVPYYWNIAPNHDATVTPRVLTDRGVMLGAEYRYLQPGYTGQFDVEYLPGDDRRDDDDRSAVAFRHTQRLFDEHGRLNVVFNNVSDDQYFEDFGRSLTSTSQRFLDRRVDFLYRRPRYYLSGIVQSFQTIDDTLNPRNQPYERLPQIRFASSHPINRLGVQALMRAETSYFDRDGSVTGGRIDVEPALVIPFYGTYYDVRPKIAIRHTEYFLDDPERVFDDRESRTVPVFSLDSSLFLERLTTLFGRNHLQTLEPRAFYLLVPNVGQEDLPRFDAGLFSVSYRNLFRENRFVGGDRVGDANQVTLAIGSRMIDVDSGRETYRVNIGQIFYFRDREVVVPGGVQEDDSVSELIAEAAVNLGADWSARGVVQWDPNEAGTELSAMTLRYRPDLDTVVNFGYRFRSTVSDVEQTDVSLRWPLTEGIAIVGRWNYSLLQNRSLETLGGVEYESCCWGVRVVGRRFLRNARGEFDNGVFVQIHFRGLGGIGKSADAYLERGIPGYEDPFR